MHPTHDHAACYAALASHDARFDGRLFVGVSSTGIYCRPVCRAKLPRAENCTFFPSAAAAEAAGYRPCLRCRPELAPGASAADAAPQLARRAALIIEEDLLCGGSIDGLAASLGVTQRHLRRVFAAQYGASPVQYLQTLRLLMAKSLLTDTAMPVMQVAMAAGFGSARRMNDLFQKRYRLSPTALRRAASGQKPAAGDAVTLYLGYRPPYAWRQMLDFLALRAVPGVEQVEAGAYRRTAAITAGGKAHTGWVAVAEAPGRDALAVTVSAGLLPVLPRVLARLRALFDLDCQPGEVAAKLEGLNATLPGAFVPGIRLPGSFDGFEMGVRAVLGQQVTVAAARTLAGRLAAALGAPVATPFPGLTHAFPAPATFASLGPAPEEHLGPLGVTRARARAIAALAGALLAGAVTLSRRATPEAEMDALLALPGFGPWTVQYLAMRALGWPDAFPHTDYGVKKALGDPGPAAVLEMAEAWRPWRAYATICLWNSLG